MSTEVNAHLMVLVFLVFLVTMYLLNIWLFIPLLNFMKKRDESLNQDNKEIADSASEVEQIKREIAQILENARREAKEMLERASDEAYEIHEAKMLKHRSENQNRLEEFLSNLQQERAILKSQVMADSAVFQEAIRAKIKQI